MCREIEQLIASVVLFVAVIGAAGCTGGASVATKPQQFDHDANLQEVGATPVGVARLDSLLQSYVDQRRASSLAAFVARSGDVVYHKAFGWRDIEGQVPATTDDYYVLFSQTKAVVTVAFMTLVEQGLVAVDDPVSDYFPGISDQVVMSVNEDGTYETRPVASPMTFAHLMSHSSGLGADLAGEVRRADIGRARDARDLVAAETARGQRSFDVSPEARYLEDEMVALAAYPLGFDPGTEWDYHVSTNMLAYMIERISGRPLREYVQATVLGPLGMDDTDWYYDDPAALDRFVKAYNAVDGQLEPTANTFSEAAVSDQQTYAEGAIGLNGPIEDYARFCQMLLNEGEFNGVRVLRPETVEQMTTASQLPKVNVGGEGFEFGLGFALFNEQRKPTPEVSNTAYAWGGLFGTEYIIDPENDVVVLFYLNMPEREMLFPEFLSRAYQLFEE